MNPYTQTEYTNAKIACNEQRKKEKSETRRREQQMDQNAQSKLMRFELEPIENPRT
jgi:hypothetical protein